MKLFNKYRSVKEMIADKSPAELERLFPHGRPMNRRDLLKSGAIGFTASLSATNILASLFGGNSAHAQAAGCALKPAFMGLKLNGGAAMMGNWVALGQDRNLISTYAQLGLGTQAEISGRMVKAFGQANFFDASPFLAGIRQTATATTLLNTSFVGIPVASTDDSANNPFDITYFVSKLGSVGSILPNLGLRQTSTGISQLPALGKMPPTPLSVGSTADIANALSVQNSLGALSDSQKGSLFSLVNKLSDSQSAKLAGATGGAVLSQLVKQATGLNATLVSGSTAGIDPAQDATISAGFNTLWATGNQNMNQQAANSQDRVFASVAYNVLKGNAGTGNLEMGGYDYHGQGRPAQDARDLSAGQVMGKLLESAALMGKPLFLLVTSDGAVGAPAGSPAGAAFTSDRGQGGAMFIFAYHPTMRPTTVNKAGAVDHQVGHVAGQAAVDTTFLTGNDPGLAGLAAFANFASFSGMLGQFTTVTGSPWNTDQIDSLVRIRQVG